MTRRRRPILAAILSFGTSGLGQLYNGEPLKGLIFFSAVWSLWITASRSGLRETFMGFVLSIAILLCALFVAGYAIVDAVVQARRKRSYKLRAYNRWYVYLVVIGVAFIASYSLSPAKIYKSYRFSSGSMQPTIHSGDRVMVRFGVYQTRAPERGELVVYEYPLDPSRDFMHRVVGLPGETLRIVDRQVFVNDEPLEEPYAYLSESTAVFADARRDNMPAVVVPRGHYFVMGDNRDNSLDSRFWGPLPVDNLLGRVLYVYWASDRSRIGTPLR